MNSSQFLRTSHTNGDPLTDSLGPFNFATFDRSRRYRYALGRTWDESKPTCAFVMLNPSTADAFQLDPTIRRCIGFAKSWGYGTLLVGNLFALRSTDPAALYTDQDPVGPANDMQLQRIWDRSEIVVTAWGNHGSLGNRSAQVMGMLGDVRTRHLGLTKAGEPRHPLYVLATSPLRFCPNPSGRGPSERDVTNRRVPLGRKGLEGPVSAT